MPVSGTPAEAKHQMNGLSGMHLYWPRLFTGCIKVCQIYIQCDRSEVSEYDGGQNGRFATVRIQQS